LTCFGWLASWNSTTALDGTYTLQSEASDVAGNQGLISCDLCDGGKLNGADGSTRAGVRRAAFNVRLVGLGVDDARRRHGTPSQTERAAFPKQLRTCPQQSLSIQPEAGAKYRQSRFFGKRGMARQLRNPTGASTAVSRIQPTRPSTTPGADDSTAWLPGP
jgi:hypothetical protein